MSAISPARSRRTWWSSVTSARGLSIVAIVIAVGTPASAATVLITAKQLAANSVTSKAIKNGSVTNADLGFVSVTSKNLAKGSVTTAALGAGAVTSANIAAGAVTASQLAPGTIPAPTPAFTLIDGMVTGSKLAAASVGASHLAGGAVTSSALLDGGIATIDLADGSVTTAKLADGSVSTAKLADSSVTTAKLVDGSATTVKLADSSVTTAKVADGSIGAADLAPAVGASLDRATTQVIPHDPWNGSSAQNYLDEEQDGTFIDFTGVTPAWATAGLLDLTTSPSRITITTSGLYQVNAAAGWNPNSTGYREVELVVNGVAGTPGTGTVVAIARTPGASNTTRALQAVSATVRLTAGDYVGVRVAQDTGSTLDLLHGSLSVVRLGSSPT
ncbi:MAG: WIAG-tail domain [Thermoleophilia bacterium]|nr:WIAG-tail domain [Thermoleophilia bacterium]